MEQSRSAGVGEQSRPMTRCVTAMERSMRAVLEEEDCLAAWHHPNDTSLTTEVLWSMPGTANSAVPNRATRTPPRVANFEQTDTRSRMSSPGQHRVSGGTKQNVPKAANYLSRDTPDLRPVLLRGRESSTRVGAKGSA
eukprot:1048562-Rhodomonas_salina.1